MSTTNKYRLLFLMVLVYLTLVSYKYGSDFVNDFNSMREERDQLINYQKTVSDRNMDFLNMKRTLNERYGFLSKYEVHYYAIIFRDFAEQYEIPWTVLAALVRVESNFDPSLKSPVGAKGMTQVMDNTGRKVAESLEIKYGKSTLWNDLLNMVIGFTYFCEQYKSARASGESGDVALKHAIGVYIGGNNYANKKRLADQIYVKEYNTSVYQEYKTLSWMYRGVSSEPRSDTNLSHEIELGISQ